MSEPKDHNDLGQGMPGIPGIVQIGPDVEDEDLQSLLQNHVDEQNSQFQTEVNFHDDSGFVGNPLEPGSAEQNIKETAIPSELQTGAEIPVSVSLYQAENGSEKPGDEVPVSMNQTENDSEKPGDQVPVSMNQTENDSEKPGNQVPVSINQTENGSEKPGNEVPVSMNHTGNDSEKAADQVPVSMNQTENGSEKPGDQVPVSMNQTENDSEKAADRVSVSMNQTETGFEKPGDEVPVSMSQTENDSGKTGDQGHAFMKQTENNSKKAGDQVPAFMNQTENVSEKSGNQVSAFMNQMGSDSEQNGALDVKAEMESDMMKPQLENENNSKSGANAAYLENNHSIETPLKQERDMGEQPTPLEGPNQSSMFDQFLDGDDSGTEEEQTAFMKELENFFRERGMEFKQPKFYGEGLNCLKLWRAVTKLGGYDRVTSCKLWRQVGESFKPPKTCTTVSWSFRGFYEKALLEYEKQKIRTGDLQIPMSDLPEAMLIDSQGGGHQASGSGRARRDAAARAMQGWHFQRALGNGEVGDPIIKDKSSISPVKRDKHLKSISGHKRKKPSNLEPAVRVAHMKDIQPHKYNKFRLPVGRADATVVDVGAPADWVKINVRRNQDCFEVYALVPGLLREEVQVQSDPAGRLIISGEPEQPDNPWGVTPFKKVITLPSQIDPHKTSAVVTLHGQLFVRAPIDQSDL